MIISEARLFAYDFLSKDTQIKKQSSTPRLDGDCFLCEILKKERSFLFTYPDFELSENEEQLFLDMLKKRKKGLPVAYILGKKEFFGYDFYVNENVLIPKPDTELLVELAIDELNKISKQNESINFADICTGSGCIPISILKTLKKFNIKTFVSDISDYALDVAKKNAENLLGEEQITFIKSDLLENFSIEKEYFHLIVSNPPYVPSDITDELLEDGRNEPPLALDGGYDGLSVIRRLLPQVFDYLRPGGVFFIETGEYNANETMDLMREIGFIDVKNYVDLAGMMRVSRGIKPCSNGDE